MSSVDDLLNSAEDGGEFDIGDEEEEALLDDNFDGTSLNRTITNVNESATDADESQEPDLVLDLDNTDFIEDETEDDVRQDRFQAERPVQQVEVLHKATSPVKPTWTDRNKRPIRGRNNNYHNVQRRNLQNITQNKRVLINPHFKGQVPIRNNISLVWDKNIAKKPSIHVQPWAQTVRPQQTSPWIQQNPVYQPPYQHQINPGIQQQKIGIPTSNIFIPPVSNLQYLQPTNVQPVYQQPTYAQQPPQSGGVNYNGFNQFAVPQYNNAPPLMCLNPAVQNCANPAPLHPSQQGYNVRQPRFEPPYSSRTVHNNFQRTFTANNESVPENGTVLVEPRRSLINMGPQSRRRYLQNLDNRPQRSNLQEIKVSDNVISEKQEPNIIIKVERNNAEEDESMIQYRRLIEDQKLLREKILKRKEERRKVAAEGVPEALAPPEELLKTVEFRAPTALAPKTVKNVKNIKKTVKMSKGRVGAGDDAVDNVDKNAITSFLSNRKIIAKDDALPDTSIVVVSNLATGSTEVKLRKLCKGVGDVKNLVISPVERQATIEFKSVASAHAFYKKYQRFMLDLSMIKVTLKKDTK